MTRPKTPDQAMPQSKYAKGDKVWVFYDVEWELGTVQGPGGSTDSSGHWLVALDADPPNPLVFNTTNIRKK
ncbi:hypothetical protein PtrSN002B_010281 [Pyrenophora tritici-repentis]|uniref:Uncharacterized protein n=1 Tax=Pyrenophora tritici-repentis TaxID=45151 RepID=A0A2W1FYQ9_9PLEO|nr:hypothetical protein PtrV1_07601 [Pyrenophora tritici-repentis]KAF7448653.1 hypothetical protein A1F99_080170 [Pyrenophora tritici-repentis]KAF7572377.1 hypothetical protein PtrM4_098770 [Pyrenophora tritici-repentis]KAG9384443.1 hypothetical protein A1F94_003990 [Pyrenophora tritici-repentis]KAI0570631.1 hypothetical protein Alg215_10934 [Pyrenophora tritici-repentis]